jgi:hypothetical protein
MDSKNYVLRMNIYFGNSDDQLQLSAIGMQLQLIYGCVNFV